MVTTKSRDRPAFEITDVMVREAKNVIDRSGQLDDGQTCNELVVRDMLRAAMSVVSFPKRP